MCLAINENIHSLCVGTNKGSMTKKAKRCSITGVVNEKSNNGNPSFELKLTRSYVHGRLCVSLLFKMSTNFWL